MAQLYTLATQVYTSSPQNEMLVEALLCSLCSASCEGFLDYFIKRPVKAILVSLAWCSIAVCRCHPLQLMRLRMRC